MVFRAPNCPLPPDNITIEDARFVYKPNFEGREETYNEEGSRYFNVLVPDNIVEKVTADGWNVKWTKPKDDERQPEPFLEVAIGFKYRPANIIVIRDGQETQITENTCGLIDKLQFETMDMVLRGRVWENPNGCGIKAWLQTFVGVVEMDDIQRKYARIREAE